MARKYKKCFVTVGTTRFDRLGECIQEPSTIKALKQIGCEVLTIQFGNSSTIEEISAGSVKDGISRHFYAFKPNIEEDIKNADLVISHAGAGSCLEVLEANKPLLVVINEDLMDNHQLELAEQLQNDGHLYYCTCDTLESTLSEVDFSLLNPFPKPDPKMFVKYLDEVLIVKPNVD